MFIRFFTKILPFLFMIQAYCAENDSVYIYWQLGLDNKNGTNFEISEISFKKAIDYSTNDNLTANIFNELGIIYMLQGKYQEAINIYDKSKHLTKDSSLLSDINVNLGIINKKIGDTKKAMLLYLKALELTNEEKSKSRIYNNIANIYYQQRNYYRALEYFQKSYSIKKIHDKKNLAYVYLNIALCYQELEAIKNAELYFNKSIQERLSLLGKDHYRLIKAYSNYGNFLAESNLKKSFDLLSKANSLALLNYSNKHPETARTFIYLGNFYLTKKEYIKALEHYQKALIANSRKFSEMDIYQNPAVADAISELEQLEILRQKAIAFQKYANSLGYKQKELKISLTTYELAIETLFKLQNSFMDESKRTLIANKKNMFAEAANVAIQLNDYPKAFQLIERGKASTLIAAINNNHAIKFSNIPDSLVKLENKYKRLQFVHSANNNTDSVLLYQTRHDSLIEFFEAKYKKYYNLKYGNKFSDPCKHLDTNQVLLEYSLTDTLCITLVVSKDGYQHHSFTVDSTFHYMLEKYINSLKKYDFNGSYIKQHEQYVTSAYYLWEKLIKPLDIPINKSLVIIPDEKLFYVAFEAFINTVADTTYRHYYNLSYLLYQHPVSYSYSAEWLFEPYLGKPTRNIGAFARDYKESSEYMSLLSSVPIAKKLTRFFKGKSYINEKCTKEVFLENAGSYKILHISMHGEIDPENETNSRLMFYDEKLNTWEIYGMQLNARLAYLRSCNTGDGILDKGEGVFSIGRAFAYAGCPTLISSLWAEKDNNITSDFYKFMKKGYSLDIAMQKAKINYLEGRLKANPNFWANKIIMGKPYSIKQKPNYLLLLAGLVLITIIVLIIKLI